MTGSALEGICGGFVARSGVREGHRRIFHLLNTKPFIGGA